MFDGFTQEEYEIFMENYTAWKEKEKRKEARRMKLTSTHG